MDTATKQAFIRTCATATGTSAAIWSQHAVAKLVIENLSRNAVESALRSREIIEDYPTTHRPLPDCLVLGRVTATDSIHIVVAVDEANVRIFVITVYRPDPERWTNDYRSRIS